MASNSQTVSRPVKPPTGNPFTDALIGAGYEPPANQTDDERAYHNGTTAGDRPDERPGERPDDGVAVTPARDLPALETGIATLDRNQGDAAGQVKETEQEYMFMLGNARNDDSSDINEAMQDAAQGRALMELFAQSYTEFTRTAQYEQLLAGQQAKWQPTIRDARGLAVGGLPVCLLCPSRSPLTNRPVIAVVLPNIDYVARLAGRSPGTPQSVPAPAPTGSLPGNDPAPSTTGEKDKTQSKTRHPYPSPGAFQAAKESNRPLTWLERRASPDQRTQLLVLIKILTPAPSEAGSAPGEPGGTDQASDQASLRATLDLIEQVNSGQRQTGFNPLRYERQLGDIGRKSLGLSVVETALFGRQAASQSTLYRVTYHPDIEAIGRQPIPDSAVPDMYKGVNLQPRQIQNLLLGHTVELTGIRDPGRGSLYRAGLHLNLLKGTTQETPGREKIKGESKQEQRLHTQLTTGKSSDLTPAAGPTGEGPDSAPLARESSPRPDSAERRQTPLTRQTAPHKPRQ